MSVLALRRLIPALALPLVLACGAAPGNESAGQATGEGAAAAGETETTTSVDHRAPVAPGIELFYRVVGEGPVTVVVPNLSQSPGPGALAESLRLVLYDSRGRGRSTPWDESTEISVARDLEDLEALRRHLGLERMALMGASYYGALAALYAAEHPERVDRVVMVAPMPVREATYQHFQETRPPHPQAAREEARMEELRRQGVDRRDPAAYCRESYRLGRHDLFGDPVTAPPLDLSFCDLPNEHLDRFYGWVEKIFESIPHWDFRDRVRRVRAPVLILQGAEDRIVPPAGAAEWAKVLPNARRVEIAGAGHLLRHERPEALVDHALPFLLGQTSPAPTPR